MKWLGLLAFIFGLAIFFFTDSLQIIPQSKPEIAGLVLKLKGQALGKNKSDSFYQNISSNSNLYTEQMIISGFDSRIFLEYGETFWLESNSSVRLEKSGSKYNIYLLSGSLKRTALGSSQFFIDGTLQNALTLEKLGVTKLTQIPIENFSIKSDSNGDLSLGKHNKQIHQTFKLHQRFIEKCFIKHYTKVSGQTQSGKIWVHFSVTRKGQLKKIKITKSAYSDKDFHFCLKEVVSRIQLKNYKGPALQIEFPINITVPN